MNTAVLTRNSGMGNIIEEVTLTPLTLAAGVATLSTRLKRCLHVSVAENGTAVPTDTYAWSFSDGVVTVKSSDEYSTRAVSVHAMGY